MIEALCFVTTTLPIHTQRIYSYDVDSVIVIPQPCHERCHPPPRCPWSSTQTDSRHERSKRKAWQKKHVDCYTVSSLRSRVKMPHCRLRLSTAGIVGCASDAGRTSSSSGPRPGILVFFFSGDAYGQCRMFGTRDIRDGMQFTGTRLISLPHQAAGLKPTKRS